ncbi:MAG: methylated-DNA--[protein]-cysteine S-methyltransferase [Thermoplasmata archaeon]
MKDEETASKVIKTPFGKLDAVASRDGLVELSLGHRMVREFGHRQMLDRLEMDLARYFKGELVDFDEIKLDMFKYTDFEGDVLQATRDIPYGNTASYRDIAENIGRPKAFRAVGNALNKNRTAIVVPCHRVISSDGGLGGFGAGMEWKKRLLRLEGIL